MLEERIEVLASGGKQAAEEDEFRYLSWAWVAELARGLTAGAKKYGEDNWREIEAKEHAARAVRHLVLWLKGEKKLEHLTNASMRCMMTWEMANAEMQNLSDPERDEYLRRLGQATEEVLCKTFKSLNGPKCAETCILSVYCSTGIEQLNTNAAELDAQRMTCPF